MTGISAEIDLALPFNLHANALCASQNHPTNASTLHLARSIKLNARPVFALAYAFVECDHQNTHRGARTHDHKVKGLALYRLS